MLRTYAPTQYYVQKSCKLTLFCDVIIIDYFILNAILKYIYIFYENDTKILKNPSFHESNTKKFFFESYCWFATLSLCHRKCIVVTINNSPKAIFSIDFPTSTQNLIAYLFFYDYF